MDNIEARLATCEANDKNIFHQLDEVKSEVKDIHKLAVSVEAIATRTEDIRSKVTIIDKRLEDVEKEPSESMKYYKRLIAGCLLTGVIGTVLGAVFMLILK